METLFENPEDILIERIATCLPDVTLEGIVKLPESSNVDSFSVKLMEKAWWCYDFIVKMTDGTPLKKENFLNGYTEAWALFYLEAAKTLSNRTLTAISDKRLPPILWTYHFPEYPSLAPYFKDNNVGAIVKRCAPWMGNGKYFLIGDGAIMKKILIWLEKGETVIGMLDYAYRSTHNSFLNFLGIPSRTPMGLFEIATRFSLDVGLLFPLPATRQLEIIKYKSSQFCSVLDLANQVVNDLSRIIMEEPQKWLLWPNINHRWESDILKYK